MENNCTAESTDNFQKRSHGEINQIISMPTRQYIPKLSILLFCWFKNYRSENSQINFTMIACRLQCTFSHKLYFWRFMTFQYLCEVFIFLHAVELQPMYDVGHLFRSQRRSVKKCDDSMYNAHQILQGFKYCCYNQIKYEELKAIAVWTLKTPLDKRRHPLTEGIFLCFFWIFNVNFGFAHDTPPTPDFFIPPPPHFKFLEITLVRIKEKQSYIWFYST